MKKLIAILLLSFATVASANAAWCYTESNYAWGKGTALTIAQACNIALLECAARTPYGDTCFVVTSGF